METEHTSPAQWVTPAALANEIQVPLGTIYQWRHRGVGPRAHKIGRHLRYRRSDIDAWLSAQADPRPAA